MVLKSTSEAKAPLAFLFKAHEHKGLIFATLLFCILFLPLESLMRMKEETTEVDEFTFSQGTSDQESNGSGSYYIRQEP